MYRSIHLLVSAGLLSCLYASRASGLDLLATIDGAAPGDMLGAAVVDAGDLNGDGRRDFAVAATATDVGGSGSGTVLVFLGSYPPNSVPELTIHGEPGDLLGSALTAGDLNADGYDDLAIGSWRNGAQGAEAGKVLILYGGNPPDAVPDRVLYGSAAGARLGRSLAGGDLNGDGVDDLAVGAPGIGAGSVYLYFGGSPFDPVSDLTLAGSGNAERFGIAVACSGDLDGDGAGDLAVGADRANVPNTWAGAVRVFRGGNVLNATPDFTLTGESGGNFFGLAVARAGDVDGDGEDDLLVGAEGYNSGGTIIDAGRAYLFRGGPAFDSTPDLTITGLAGEEFLGSAVAGGVDLNRDGKDDLAIGVPGAAGDAGAVRIYFGANPLNNTLDDSIAGEAAGDNLGQAVALVDDADRNGAGEALAGAWGHASDAGRAYLHGDPGAPPIGVEPLTGPALSFHVGPPRPHPARSGSAVALTLERTGPVRVDLLDVNGRLLRRLVDRELAAGTHAVVWDGRLGSAPAPAGTYLLRVSQGAAVAAQKLVLLP
jgi:hypothetical protein